MKIWRWLLAGLAMVVLTACGGGSSNNPDNSNTTTNTNNSIVLSPNVTIINENTQENIEQIEGIEGETGTLILKDTQETQEWKVGEIKYLPVDDKTPEGMFFKIADIETKDGKKSIVYTTPTLDEVFDELNITMDSNISFVVDRVQMSKYAKLQVNQLQLPKGARGKLSKLAKDPDVEKTVIKGSGWNLFKKLNIDFKIPVLESDHTSLTLGGKFSLDNINVTKFHFENYHAASEFSKLPPDSFLNKLTPTVGVHYAFGLEYDAQKEFNIEGKLESKLSLAEIAKETMFECGITKSKSIGGTSISFTSNGYGEHDICLGSVGVAIGYDAKKKILVPGVDVNAGSGKSLLKIGIDIAMILGLDGEIHMAMKFSGQKKSYELMEGEIDSHQLKNGLDNFITGRSIESLSKGSSQQAKWTYKTTGEIGGTIEHYMGLAAALHISNITPIGLRGYGGLKADAKAEIYSRNGYDWAACSDIGINLIYGVEILSRNSLNIKLSEDSKISKWIDKINDKYKTGFKKEFNPGINFKLPLVGGDDTAIALLRHNSCDSSEYLAQFSVVPTGWEGFKPDNIIVKHINGTVATPESIDYMVYNSDGDLIATGDSTDIIANLAPGTYEIRTVLGIDHIKAIKTSLSTTFTVKSDTVPPVITLLGTTPVALTVGDTYLDAGATATDDVDGDVDVTVVNDNVDTSAAGVYHVVYSAKDSAGNEATATREVKVTDPENSSPVAVAAASATAITEGESVSFDASQSHDSDGEIVSYEWKEGDSLLSTEVSFTHDSLSAGRHILTLTVTDDGGASDTDTVEVSVESNQTDDILVITEAGSSVTVDLDTVKTIRCQALSAGDTFSINDVEYVVVDNDTIRDIKDGSNDFEHICTSLVTDMSQLFRDNSDFNQTIGKWDVNSVTNMWAMFAKATKFNQSIGDWDVSSVTEMSDMFAYTDDFNQPLEKWDVSSVIYMYSMFAGTKSFNQPLEKWDVSSVTSMTFMFAYAKNFNQPLEKWDISSVTNMTFMFAYTDNFNQPLEKWDVSSVTYMTSMFAGAKSFNQPIGDWNVSAVTNMGGMFNGAESFDQPIGDWNVSAVTDMNYMFAATKNFNQPIGNWDVSAVTDMSGMFNGAESFDQPIGDWNVSAVTDMYYMFANTDHFNQPIGDWNVSAVTNMANTFSNAINFNQSIVNWDVSSVTNMFEMFYDASSFSGHDLSKWDVKNVEKHGSFLTGAGSGNTEPNWEN